MNHFPALYLSATLLRRLEELGQKEHFTKTAPARSREPARLPFPWEKLLQDLSQVRAVTVRLDEQRYLMRTELKGHASEVFCAVGLRPPPLAALLTP